MGRKEKLLQKAQESASNLSFKQLCTLAGYAGYEFMRQKGSHKQYMHPTIAHPDCFLNLQPGKNGEAKPYQVKQLLDYIDSYKLLRKEK